MQTRYRVRTASLVLALALGSGAAFYGGRAYQSNVDQPLFSQYTPAQSVSAAPAQSGAAATPVATAGAGTPVAPQGSTAVPGGAGPSGQPPIGGTPRASTGR